jgi:arylsulfatase A-like enzyme
MPRVALVVLDTVRKDTFSKHFDWLDGSRFERAYAPSHWTPPVHAALFCGKYGSELGVRGGPERLDCPEPTLAECLSDASVRTRAFSANPYVSRYFNFDRGFDEFRQPWQLDGLDPDVINWQDHVNESSFDPPISYFTGLARCVTDSVTPFRSLVHGARLYLARYDAFGLGDDGARDCLKYIREAEFTGEDEFLFCNLMEAHEPYEPPREYRTTDIDRLPSSVEMTLGDVECDAGSVRQAYEDAVRYLSDRYREIHAELTADFDYVITCGDHGEVFDRDGLWGHIYGVYPELTHVPLVISGNDVEATTHDETVGLLDVHHTIADLFDVEVTSRGRNILGEVVDGEYLTETHGIAEDRLANLDTERHRQRAKEYDTSLYGYATSPDYYGYETPDGYVGTGTAEREGPRERMTVLRNQLEEPSERDKKTEKEVSESVQTRLEELGYV